MNRSHILALAAFDDQLIYSCGPFLFFGDCRKPSQVLSNSQQIHGIHIKRDLAILWGRTQAVVVNLPSRTIQKQFETDSWILHCFFEDSDCNVVALCTKSCFYEKIGLTVAYQLDGLITAACSFGDLFAYANVDGCICLGMGTKFFAANSFPLSLWMNEEWLVCCCSNGKIFMWPLIGALGVDCAENVDCSFGVENSNVQSFSCSQGPIAFVGHENRPWKAQIHPQGFLISIGEDCTVRKWSLSGQLLDISHFPTVGNIFSLAFMQDSIFIGCFDGCVRQVFSPSPDPQETRAQLANFTLVSWNDRLLGDESLRKYCLMERDPSDNQLIWATDLKGIIYCLRPGKCEISPFQPQCAFKVNRIFCCERNLYFWSLSRSNWMFNPLNGEEIKISQSEICITSLCTLPKGLIVVGTRAGKLFCNNQIVDLSKDAISSMAFDHDSNVLWCASRDGFIHSVQLAEGTLTLRNQFQICTVEGGIEWIALWGSSLLSAHFYNKKLHLSLHSPWEIRILACWECGGGHRTWKIYLEGCVVHFGFLRKGLVTWNYLDLSKVKAEISTCKGHSKTVRSSVVACEGNLLLTAGDDGIIMGWEACLTLAFASPKIHTSTINALYWNSKVELLFSGGGNSELVAWKVLLQPKELKMHKKCEFSPSFDADLRIMALSGTDSGLLYASYSNGEVYSFDLELNVIAVYRPTWKNCFVSCMRIGEDSIIFGFSNGRVCRLDSSLSAIDCLWRHTGSVTKVCLVDGIVYSAGYDGQLIASSYEGKSTGLLDRRLGDDIYNRNLGYQNLVPCSMIASSLLSLNGLCSVDNQLLWIDAAGMISCSKQQISQSFIGDICGIIGFKDQIIVFGGSGIQSLPWQFK